MWKIHFSRPFKQVAKHFNYSQFLDICKNEHSIFFTNFDFSLNKQNVLTLLISSSTSSSVPRRPSCDWKYENRLFVWARSQAKWYSVRYKNLSGKCDDEGHINLSGSSSPQKWIPFQVFGLNTKDDFAPSVFPIWNIRMFYNVNKFWPLQVLTITSCLNFNPCVVNSASCSPQDFK